MWYGPQYNKWRYEKDADSNLYPPDAIQTAYQRGLSEGRKAGLLEAVEIAEGIEKKDTYPYGAIISEALTREMEGTK